MAMDFHHCWYKTVVFLFLALWTTLSCGTTPYSTIHPTPSSGYSGYMLSYSSRHSQPYMSGSYSGHHPSGYSQPYMSDSYSGHHPSGYSQPHMSGSYSGQHPSGYSQPYISGSYSGHHPSGYSQPYMSGSYSGHHPSGYSQPYMSGSYSGHHPSGYSQPYMSGSYSGHRPSGYSQPYMSGSYSGHHPSGYSQPYMSGSYSGHHPSGYSQPYMSGSYSGHHPSGYSQPYMSGSYSGHHLSGYSQPYMSGSYSGQHHSGYSQPYMSGSYSGHHHSGYSQPYISGSYSGHHHSGYSQPYMSGSYSGHHHSGYSQPYMSGSYSGHHPSGYSQPYMSGSYSGHHPSGYSQPYMSGSYSGHHPSGYSQPYMSGSYSGHHPSGYSQQYMSGSYSGHHPSGYSQPYMSGSYSGHHPSRYSQPYMSGSYSAHHPSGYSQPYMTVSYSDSSLYVSATSEYSRSTTASVITTTAIPRDTFTYVCPGECFCKTSCMALDVYGDLIPTFSGAITYTAAFTEFKQMTAFQIDIQISTCEGFLSFFGVYNSLTANDKVNMASFINDPTTVTADTMTRFPKAMFALLKFEVKSRLNETMSDQQKMVICNNWKSVNCLAKSAIMEVLKCGPILASGGESLTTTEKKKLFNIDLFASMSLDDWGLVLQYAPELLNKTHLEAIPVTVLVENMGVLTPIVTTLKTSVIKAIMEVLKVWMIAEGTVATEVRTQWIDLAKACGASEVIMEVLGLSASLSVIDMSQMSREDARKFLEENEDGIDMASLTKDEIVSMIAALDQSDILLLNDAALVQAAAEIFSQNIGRAQMRKIVEAIKKKLPSFFDTTTFDDAKLEIVGPVMGYLSDSEIAQIPDSVLQSGINNGYVASSGKSSRKSVSNIIQISTCFQVDTMIYQLGEVISPEAEDNE
ncbi:mucin-3B-like [Argopecten irradians]|uniref:mucin-3B-like n=1 Tax=Argopecten irradians TaxID=31199 RepID=UPI00371432C3